MPEKKKRDKTPACKSCKKLKKKLKKNKQGPAREGSYDRCPKCGNTCDKIMPGGYSCWGCY